MMSASSAGPVFLYSSRPSTKFEVLGYVGMYLQMIVGDGGNHKIRSQPQAIKTKHREKKNYFKQQQQQKDKQTNKQT